MSQKKSEKRTHHLRVPVSCVEKKTIKDNAKNTGNSIANYLRAVGQGYPVKSILDYEEIKNLLRVNGELGHLAELFKTYLSFEKGKNSSVEINIVALLEKIKMTQDELRSIIRRILK